MRIKTFKGGYDGNFAYVVDSGEECIIIDPSVLSKQIFDYISENNLKLKFVVIMHSHFDHLVDLEIYSKKGIPIYGHESIEQEVDRKLKDNDKIGIKEVEFKVLHTPGHRFDCICLYDGKNLFTSDTLFVEGCGRVDFPGSDPEKMVETLELLKSLPDETIIYPGHDYGSSPTSTIGKEKENNRFFKMNKDEFISERI